MFNKYPYTDFHEANLSWMLDKIKSFDSIIDDIDQMNQTIIGMQQSIADIQTELVGVSELIGSGVIE